MEDFQPQWAFDAEKFNTGYIAASLPFPGAGGPYKNKQFGAFDALNGLSDQIMTPNLKFLEPMGMMRLNKDDEFDIGSPASHKPEHQQFQASNVNQSHLEMLMEPAYAMKPQDFNLDFYQIRRSRGPSFNISRDRKGSEDFFNGNFDFMRFFRNPIPEPEAEMPNEFVKAEYEPNFGSQLEKAPLMYSYGDALQASKVANYDAEDKQGHGTSEETGADESTLQESVQGSENSLENNTDLETAPVTKKKRKTNNNAVITEPAVQKKKPTKVSVLKKSKSENKNAVYSLTPKGNAFSLKITKMPESTEQEAPQSTKAKRQSSKTSTNADPIMAKVKTEEGQTGNDSPNEASQSQPINGKSETTNPLMRSNSNILSSLFQGKNPGSIGDLVAGLGLPAEVEELLNSSKIFSNFQLSSTKKIGPLTVEERKAKVEKYLEKRKNRTWCKKINYDCRKRVADSRLRFKGRFVTKTQAFAMLEEEGIFPDQNKITEAEIKNLLELKFGSDPVKKKEKEGDGRKNNGRPKKQAKQEMNVKNEEEWMSGDGNDESKSAADSDDDE